MVEREKIIDFLDKYLEIDKWPDDPINGLSVSGQDNIERIITAVSPSLELFKRADSKKADLIICHHPLNYEDPSPDYVRRRISFLKDRKINYANYHLPLDFNQNVGNAVLTAKEFGLNIKTNKLEERGFFGGDLLDSVSLAGLKKKAELIYGQKPFVLASGPEEVVSVAIFTGSGGSHFEDAFKVGITTVIIGQINEWEYQAAKEMGLNILACGHYNTEKVGIKALGKLVAKEFNVAEEFIDIPNPI